MTASVAELTAGMSAEQRAALAGRVRAKAARLRTIRECPTPLDLACRYDPTYVRTAALELVAVRLVDAVRKRDGRLIISIGPQQGKSSLLRWMIVWALVDDPDRRIVFASYAAGLARTSGRIVRGMIETHGEHIGLAVSRIHADAADWELDGHKGGMFSTGRGAMTGRPSDWTLVDDPLRDQQEADSPVVRGALHDWWDTVARTRLAPGAPAVVVQCMTGDTPVLMGDGTEKPLCDVRPGDTVATFENGALTTSAVRNWAGQGLDSICTIRMKSGRVVRANARHPFLTIEDGERVWRRTDQLTPGSVIQTVTGANGAALLAQTTDATSPPNARACACPTTASGGGPTGIERRPSTPLAEERHISSTATASTPLGSPPSSRSRVDSALSVASPRPIATPAPTGTGSSASTTTTPPARSGDFSATTAIWSPGTANRPTSFAQPLFTWKPEPDEVLEVVPCGTEDVFDLQIDRTENFIANGLVSHNTRWAEDDLAGRLAGEGWPVVNIPAQADGQTPDALGRATGEWLVSARGTTVEDWVKTRRDVGERTWASLYQGRPAPLAGGVFQKSWFDTWRVTEAPPGCLPPTVIVDPADNEGDGDEAGIILATAHPETGKVYLLDDLSAPMTVARWARVALLTCARRGAPSLAYEKSLSQLPKRIREAWTILRQQATALHRTHGDQVAALARLSRADDSAEAVEQTAVALAEIGGDVDAVLAIPEAGPRLRPIVARGSKQLRMQLAAPMFETGRAVVVGRLAQVEHQLTTWSPGMDSPDRADAVIHSVNLLSGGSVGSLGRADDRVPTTSTGLRNRSTSNARITRSTRR